MSPYALALDAGGTATKCWVVEADGTVAGASTGGPGNHILDSPDRARASIAGATAAALTAAGCAADDIASVVAGCSGIEASGETRGPIEQLLQELVPAAAARSAVGDMVAAFYGALPEGVGVVVVAGTGAVSYGKNTAGETAQIDGWGHLLGDEGSGYWLGRAGLQAAARALDGRGEPTALAERLPAALGAAPLSAAAYALYAAADQRERVAALAATVAACAADGDGVAAGLVADAGAALAASATAAVRRLGLEAEPVSVATSGSLFHAGALLMESFATAVHARVPAAQVQPGALPPVGGAAKLAWAAVGREWGRAEIARAQATQSG